MSRMTNELVEVADHLALDDMIAQLTAIRDSLPDGADARVKLRGDEHFGRHLCVAYRRPLTQEEADCLARYSGDVHELRRAA